MSAAYIFLYEKEIRYILSGETEILDTFPAKTKQQVEFAAQEIARDMARLNYNGGIQLRSLTPNKEQLPTFANTLQQELKRYY